MQMLSRLERAGLLWIGMEHYPSPIDFDEEAARPRLDGKGLIGVSRRVPKDQMPRGFKVGEDWVFLAHQKAVTRFDELSGKLVFERGVFRVFKPNRIEVIVTEETPDEEIEAYIERGLTPVIVRRMEQREMELA